MYGGEACSYTLSTGAKVDSRNLPSPYQSGNGAAAEKWCENRGKRLPTLAELKEMYKNRKKIGGFTDGFDAGGWPYWSERVTNNSDGKDYGYRIIFGDGAEDYVKVTHSAYVRKFGEPGEVQYRPFWIHSGAGAYVRCVSDSGINAASPNKNRIEHDSENFSEDYERKDINDEKYAPIEEDINESKNIHNRENMNDREHMHERRNIHGIGSIHKRENIHNRKHIHNKEHIRDIENIHENENIQKENNSNERKNIHKRKNMHKEENIHETDSNHTKLLH